MPSISRNMLALWRNYHLTAQGLYRPLVETDPGFGTTPAGGWPEGSIRDTAAIHCADVQGMPGPQMLAATGQALQAHIAWLIRQDPQAQVPRRPPLDCVPLGRGWSFSSLCAARDAQIDLTGLSGAALAQGAELHPRCAYSRGKVGLVLGGTRLRELTSWAQPKGLSIRTSGTHLGLTAAGAAATASHGSRLGFGGVQNMVVGLHLITGPDSSVWIERASKPVLSGSAVSAFASQGALRDDAVFEDALVHLGAMGIVNAVAMELVEDTGYDLKLALKAIGPEWLDALGRGAWRGVAREMGRDAEPAFYELTIDPRAWDSNPAIHTLYFPSTGNADALAPSRPLPGRSFADMVGAVETLLAKSLPSAEKDAAPPPLDSVFEIYKRTLQSTGLFIRPPTNVPWNHLHGDEITGGFPGSLYNASFAIARADLPAVIPLICKAVADLPPTFLFTVRFVSNPAGTLAFTRFAENAVIEIDGFSRHAPLVGPAIGHVIEEGARRLRACLDGQNPTGRAFPHGMHWGKLGNLDAAKIEADYGPSADPASRISRWRATRARLLSPAMQALFWNAGVAGYGLVTPPAGAA